LDLDSFRELMVEAKKQELTPSDLASRVRLLNYFKFGGSRGRNRVIHYES
jgi:hypothetical protein